MDENVRVSRLQNGLRVVTESVRDVASVALGIWVENGSRHENPHINGVSHFIEHLIFKGTPTRGPRQIAEEIESLGGTINALTGKEYTCYHTRTLHEHAGVALDVLSDIFLNPCLRNDDVELERDVIIQEILDVEDTPDDFIHDYYLGSYWPGHPLGWPVAGTVESVSRITRDDVFRFMRERYRADRVIVAAAGHIDHDWLLAACRERFGQLESGAEETPVDRPDFRPGVYVAERELEQVHLVVGMPGVSMLDDRRELAEVILAALGGGMSSRLFQSIREERGKAYAVYSFQSPFRDIGYTGVYAATGRDTVSEVVDMIFGELREISVEGLGAAELERTKNQLIGSIPLALECTESRMFRIARNQLYFDRPIPIAEVIAELRAVTNADVVELAREIFSFERAAMAMVGDAEASLVSLPAA